MLLHVIEKSVDTLFALIPRKKPKSTNGFCLIAHRGAHNKKQRIIENTALAFAEAKTLGCWGIEFDVHATADGVLVINHDPTLNRLWGQNFSISQLSFEELRQRVPEILTLAEVVERYAKDLHLFVELKAPFNAESSLVKDLAELTPAVDYHLISLCETTLAVLKAFPREAMLLVAVHNNLKQFSKLCLEKDYGGVLGHYLLFSNYKMNQLQQANKAVGVGMVDSRFGLYRELRRGMPWIFSNNIESVKEFIEDLK